MNFERIILFVKVVFLSCSISAQHPQQLEDPSAIPVITPKYLQAVNDKADQIEKKLDAKTCKILQRFQKQERRLQHKLSGIDSVAAKRVFSGAQEQYASLEKKISNSKFSQYIPSLDSITTSLQFLDANPQFLSTAKDAKEKLQDAFTKLDAMKGQLQKAEEVKKFLRERKQWLKEQLERYGLGKELKKMSNDLHLYSEQLKTYKELWRDHKKAERKALELLSKTKLFKDFMRKNSLLASLFRMPGDPADPLSQASLAGLQTRAQVNALIQNQVAAGGAAAQQQLQQNMQQAQGQLQELKNKLAQYGRSSSDEELPEGVKPSDQRAKSFRQRFEPGISIQSVRSNGVLPVTTDVGLSIGYRLDDKKTAGLFIGYKLGWGESIRKIKISHQGMSLRSFVDWKLRGSLWLTGGFEMNYRAALEDLPISSFRGREPDVLQPGALIGLSKLVPVKTRFFKDTKLQLLWNLLSYNQIPRTQPVVFRVGYNL